MGDQAVDRFALGLHGAAFGRGDLRGDLGERFRRLAVGQGAVAERERPDQRAVHHEVGIAADRRGEMRVAPQVEPEVAVVLGGVFGLGLRAQHHLVDELFGLVALHLRQHAVEHGRPQRAALCERHVERAQEFLEVVDLLHGRLVMHAIDQRQRLLLQHLGGGDIGEDHELLDQPVRVEPRRNHDAIDGAVRLQDDLAFRQIEIERIARVAGALHQRISVVERPQDRRQQRAGGVVGFAVDRGLSLRVMQLRRRAHQHAVERV